MSAAAPWESWAPPLAPPVDGGLPVEEAQRIADDWWDTEPHLASALQWEAWAATLAPSIPVAQVATGMQSVSYGRAVPGGELGAAMSRAAWHRSFLSALISVPLVSAVPHPSTRTGPPTSCPW